MIDHHTSGLTGASGAMTLDRIGPTAAIAAPTVTATIPIGSESDAVAVNPVTGDVYVTNFSDGTVSVISGLTGMVVATIPVGDGPVGVAVHPPTGAVYTAHVGDHTVSVISG
jgi:YVTN family beta-propeller protein